MQIKVIDHSGIHSSIRAMRLPHNSEGDTGFSCILGAKDLELATKLTAAGAEHAKFARGIVVWMDITAPRYWWQEMATYRIGAECLSSESTMHTILNKDLRMSDFTMHSGVPSEFFSIISAINNIRSKVVTERLSKIEGLRLIKSILPESFNQRRIYTFNYQCLRNIYRQRKSHKLPEWNVFCDAVTKLPYAKELICQ